MDRNTKFGYWIRVAPLTGFKIGKFTRPSFVGDVQTPENLNGLTIGQLIDLSELGDNNESLYKIIETVLGMSRDSIDNARAVDVVRFVGWVSSEVEKINRIFGGVDKGIKPTQQEKQAGIDTLKFGLFGMLDWYAVRMGIDDQDKVLDVPWMRIYKCMDMDNKRRAYEIRLNKIQAESIRRGYK